MSFLAATNIDVLNFTSFSLIGLRVGRAAATPRSRSARVSCDVRDVRRLIFSLAPSRTNDFLECGPGEISRTETRDESRG